MAHLCGDAELQRQIKAGDFFEALAKRWSDKQKFGGEWRARSGGAECEVPGRAAAKQLCYGLLYGMGANTMSEQLKCAKEDAQKRINDFFAVFPGMICSF